ncbi:unnamed protein product [Chrysoparadoxa australica]
MILPLSLNYTSFLRRDILGCITSIAALSVMSRQEKPEGVTIALTGDVMLGRLVDQTLPHPFQNGTADSAMRPRVRAIAGADQLSDQELYERPWGDTKDLLKRADLTLINLETSITQHSEKWPAKVFNYRMHPLNAPGALTAAGVDFCSLANNHVLDFGYPGLTETLRVLELAGIAHTGAGENAEEAMKPAVLTHESSGLKVTLSALASKQEQMNQNLTPCAHLKHFSSHS